MKKKLIKKNKEDIINFFDATEELSAFSDWLHYEGIFDKYIYNIRHYNPKNLLYGMNTAVGIQAYLNSCEPYCYIIDAFDWGKTEEGFDYWDDIDNSWFNYNNGFRNIEL